MEIHGRLNGNYMLKNKHQLPGKIKKTSTKRVFSVISFSYSIIIYTFAPENVRAYMRHINKMLKTTSKWLTKEGLITED